LRFESGGDVDAITHQVAVILLNDITEMYADTKVDAPLRG
jgi:hypothetical protein